LRRSSIQDSGEESWGVEIEKRGDEILILTGIGLGSLGNRECAVWVGLDTQGVALG